MSLAQAVVAEAVHRGHLVRREALDESEVGVLAPVGDGVGEILSIEGGDRCW